MAYNPETKRFEISVHGFRNFMQVVNKALADGYTLEGGVFPQPFGERYAAQLYKAGATEVTDTNKPSEGVEDDKSPKSEAGSEETNKVSDTTVPDWELLDKLVLKGDKDAIEAYCKPFGIDLNKRKSPANMLTEFKEFVGAV